ncbi:hypothetical protein ACIOHE_26305 [Streptomyces sp. NPDC087851]|uniref:hypothetical protein n=1 Tax=Streptomyces sp. NPDC087851 TaxID=3365810 RepID=UPI003809BC57
MPSEPSSSECQHPNRYNYAASGNATWTRYYSCPDCKAKWQEQEPEEPPLTPEEEERAPEDVAVPPEPVRRPPYAVAYAVAGTLYEVAVPGDAIVTAVDGALVIKHAVGFVAGITGVYPIEYKTEG